MSVDTKLMLGPRGKRLQKAGLIRSLLWRERYKEEYTGYFQEQRDWLETASVVGILDLWCRGNNLIGFTDSIIDAVDGIRKACKATPQAQTPSSSEQITTDPEEETK